MSARVRPAMDHPLEDYALLADTETAALVRKDGAIDWFCVPRFDGAACFAALLGDERNGSWELGPAGEIGRVERRYRPGSLILETDLHVDGAVVRLVDFMPPRDEAPNVVRLVRGVRGRVPMRMRLAPRFAYGDVRPVVTVAGRTARLWAGPDALAVRSEVELAADDAAVVADFTIGEGEELAFQLEWHPAHDEPPQLEEPRALLDRTEAWWAEWSRRCSESGELEPVVRSSTVVLKGLTYWPTGGIVAAPTTSLPEEIGGVRNWDYRFCWLRDATLVLLALMNAGYHEEAVAWRDWLLRAVAGEPGKLHILYGLAGEQRIWEHELPWLRGYAGSSPVRIGNAAIGQLQLDVYGEVMDCFHQARRAGVPPDDAAWNIQQALLEHLEGAWTKPDEGIWEIRGAPRQFTHSKVMAWTAFDRGVKAVERYGLEGPLDRWRAKRDEIHRDVCRNGWHEGKQSFVQAYGDDELDAALLLIPEVGFLPPTDARVRTTIEAIERELMDDGFVRRYRNRDDLEGLPGREGVFLACSFWMVDALVMIGRVEDARRLFDRLLAIRNDVGLLAEQWDPGRRRLVGNFPQAFSHVGLINSAVNLTHARGPSAQRGSQ